MNPLSNLKLYIFGALVLVALSLFGYHKLVVSAQQTKIERLEKEREQLQRDVKDAVLANDSMKAQVDRLELQSKQIVTILKAVQEKDQKIGEWFDAAKNSLTSDSSREKIAEKLKNNPAEAINDANAEVECTIANMGRLGVCVGSIFVPYEETKR